MIQELLKVNPTWKSFYQEDAVCNATGLSFNNCWRRSFPISQVYQSCIFHTTTLSFRAFGCWFCFQKYHPIKRFFKQNGMSLRDEKLKVLYFSAFICSGVLVCIFKLYLGEDLEVWNKSLIQVIWLWTQSSVWWRRCSQSLEAPIFPPSHHRGRTRFASILSMRQVIWF